MERLCKQCTYFGVRKDDKEFFCRLYADYFHTGEMSSCDDFKSRFIDEYSADPMYDENETESWLSKLSNKVRDCFGTLKSDAHSIFSEYKDKLWNDPTFNRGDVRIFAFKDGIMIFKRNENFLSKCTDRDLDSIGMDVHIGRVIFETSKTIYEQKEGR